MTIKIDNNNERSLLSIDGELTIYKAKEYRDYLVDNFTADKVLEVNLEGVEEIDSSGLQLLAAMSKQLSNNGNEIVITAASDEAKDALETSRLMTDMKFIIEGVQHES